MAGPLCHCLLLGRWSAMNLVVIKSVEILYIGDEI
jgi:hypothetical protein